MVTTSRVSLGELVLDFSVYPRSQISDTHVGVLADAYAAGVELPPMRADKRSKRLSDGFHRYRMYRRVLPPAAELDVELVNYANEAELIEDAVRLNVPHGRAFSPFDRARVITLLGEHGVALERIASDLSITVEKAQSLRDTRRAFGAQGEPVTLKQSVASFMHGKTLTPEQKEAHAKLDGMRPLFHVNQLTLLIKNDMVEWTDEFKDRLLELVALVEEKT